MEILDRITPYLTTGMFTVLAVFVVLGILFGMGRGLQRSTLRLVLFGGLLLVAFFLTPSIIKGTLNLNISVNGKPIDLWVDELSDNLVVWLQENCSAYVAPFQGYIKEYAMGIILALMNLVLFLLLYIVVKIVSWIIYAVVAPFAAPKRNRDGKKKNKHAAWGALVGAVQGLILFAFFLLPVNGLIGVVHQAADYSAQAAQDSTTQTAAVHTTAAGATNGNNTIDLPVMVEKVDTALGGYQKFMQYSGLQFLSDKAFEYQLTVRVDGSDEIDLLHDLNLGWELYVDAPVFTDTMEKLGDAFQNDIDLTQMTKADYRVMREFTDKALQLQILQIADRLLGDLDQIMNAPIGEDDTYLAGTEIYTQSFYGMLIRQNVTERVVPLTADDTQTVAPTNYAQFAKGLQALVNYIQTQKMTLVRNDVAQVIDFLETISTYQITYHDAVMPQTVAEFLKNAKAEPLDIVNFVTARLAVAQDDYAVGTPLINVLGDKFGKFSLAQMLCAADVDNLITYSKWFEGVTGDVAGGEAFLYDFTVLFVGDDAMTHTDENGVTVEGNWHKLSDLILRVGDVFREYCTFNDDVAKIKNDLLAKNPDLSADSAQIQAMIQYLGDLVMTEEEFNLRATEFDGQTYDVVKYQKVDQLIDAVYDTVNLFKPVKTFLLAQLNDMKTNPDENNYVDTLVTMLQSEKANWYSTIHTIVNAANLLNNSVLGDLVGVLQDVGQMTQEELTAKVLDTVTQLDAEDISEVVYTMMTIPEVGDKAKDAVATMFKQVDQIQDEDLQEIFGAEDAVMVREEVTHLQNYLQNFDSATATEADKTELTEIVNNLWTTVQGNENLDNYLKNLAAAA